MPSAAEAFDHDRQGPAAPVEGAVAGGTVTMLTSSEFEHTVFGRDGGDPTGTYNWASFMSSYVTRSLTQYVYDPAQAAMVLVPDIATDLGTPNADFTEWTFTIRDGVRFEDGTEVTAERCRVRDQAVVRPTAFQCGPTYSNDYFLDGDTYQGPYRSGTDYDGVVVDGDTVTIKMARPFPDMPYWATYPAMGPIPENGSDPDTYGRHPLATGPYKFASYTPRGVADAGPQRPSGTPTPTPADTPTPTGTSFRFGHPDRADRRDHPGRVGCGADGVHHRHHQSRSACLRRGPRPRPGERGQRRLHLHMGARLSQDQRYPAAAGDRLRLPVPGRRRGSRTGPHHAAEPEPAATGIPRQARLPHPRHRRRRHGRRPGPPSW